MRVMALDIGEKRIGVAISDPEGMVATPLKVLPAQEVLSGAKSFRMLLEDWQPDTLLCGLPYSLDGEEHAQAQSIRQKAQTIAQLSDLPLLFADERLSSQEAKRSLREKGLSEREMRGKVDMIAACLFLQAWLDQHRAE